ncbi:sodium:proton exchanger [Thiohalorhabdus denitrificans]|uniref:Transporter, CPA2 family n=1 Tax=Thiohalorhabdus denitrificans TaxID=381306 RepID=A0A0P9C7Y0_9GAMM|nr:cation:proton antiporter [Thiohalorhabdus denitrificans]KPV41062.1 sodium:proton exchanger [Thiohalorhabdus denitrificans]SCY40007.1 transporter, CPA2 family [Thiohalorhabdus denitrificans]
MASTYHEIALLLLISAGVGLLGIRLRQPLIVAFIVVGLAVGPAGLGLVTAHTQIELLAEIGITILLFLVGLKLDLHLVRRLGPVALATGLGQLGFTIAFGYLIGLALGLEPMTALYVAVALTFSSTIIIVKLLSDKHEIDALHGRIAMGFLIVQDIAVVVAMALLGASGGQEGGVVTAATAAATLVAVMGAVLLLMRYVFPRLVPVLGQSHDLLLIFAVAWGTGLASLGEVAGFGKEVGAFLAGFSLASAGHRELIGERLASLRDFLLLFFFIDLGSKLDLSTLGGELGSAAVLSAFVLVGNPLVVLAIMGFMGYRKRTGFLAGLTVAQISEFSIIFIALGISLGHIGEEALGLVTMVGLVTITLSTYMILYSNRLFGWVEPWLGPFERRHPHREMAVEERARALREARVVVMGMGRLGRRIAARLQAGGTRVVGVDFDPEAARRAEEADITVFPGDASDPEVVKALPGKRGTYIISTVPKVEPNLALWRGLGQTGNEAEVLVAAFSDRDTERLTEAGIPRLLLPYASAAEYAAETVAGELMKGKRA